MTRIFIASIFSFVSAASVSALAIDRAPASSPVVAKKLVPVSNAGEQSSKPRTLSFDEFKQLGAADAEAYLEDLRQFALKVEAVSPNADVTQNLWMTLLMANAHAAGTQCVYAGYVMDNEADCKAHKAQSSWTLPDGSTKTLCGGQTVCNPMLYGFGPGQSGICLPKSSASTTACDAAYRKIPDYKGSDIAKQLSSPKLKQEFDSQSTKVKGYCSTNSGTSQQKMCSYVSGRATYLGGKIAASAKGGATKKAAAPPAEDKTKKNAEKTAADVDEKKANAEAKSKKEAEAKAKADAAAKVKADAAAKTAADANTKASKAAAKNASTSGAGSAGTPGNADAGRGGTGGAGGRGPGSDAAGSVAGQPGSPAGADGSGGKGGAGGNSAKAPEKAPEKKEEKKKEAPKDNCIRNREEYMLLKDKMPIQSLKTLDKEPAYFTHAASGGIGSGIMSMFKSGDAKTEAQKDLFSGYMELKLIGDSLKVSYKALDPAGDFHNSKDTDFADKICIKGQTLELTFRDGVVKQAVLTKNGIIIKDPRGSPEWTVSSASEYQRYKSSIEGGKQVMSGGQQ